MEDWNKDGVEEAPSKKPAPATTKQIINSNTSDLKISN